MNGLYIGFDIGTDSINALVANDRLEIVYSPKTVMHFGNPVDALKDLYDDILLKYPYENVVTTAFTGSVSEFIALKLGMPFFHDTITIPAGASSICPDAHYIFHMGAKDPYYFEKEKVKYESRFLSFTPDHSTGTKCGGGSGILITKQCRRFFENEFPVNLGDERKKNRETLQARLEKTYGRGAGELERYDKEISVGGRCGVVIQSDMIHLQNRGEEIGNILRGMYLRVIKNYRSDVLRTRSFDPSKRAVATGGIFSSSHLSKMLQDELGIPIEVPRNFEKVGAMGAIIKGRDAARKFRPDELNQSALSVKDNIKSAPPLSLYLDRVKIYEESGVVSKRGDISIFTAGNGGKRNVLIGLDGGSTTTKAVLLEEGGLALVAVICLYTNGRPLQTAQEIFRQVDEHLGGDIVIKGVAYTGSSGAFYYRMFTRPELNSQVKGIDMVKDEITCHARGVRHFNGGVDTIFELGGQDAKFTLFNSDGTVKKSKMNLSCMAGTGQTMQNMAEMLGLDIETSFHESAMRAKSTPVVDDTCGVFTEAGIAKLIALGFPRDEIAAAIAYGFMGGYINKFVGNEKFGALASAQGGPFNGISCLAALAMHTDMEIHAFPRRQLFGALGAAIALNEEINKCLNDGVPYESRFMGLEATRSGMRKNGGNCSAIVEDSCAVKDCILEVYEIGGNKIYSGGACPKGNTGITSKRAPDYVGIYRRILEKHIAKYTVDINTPTGMERILIPRSLTFLNEKGVFYIALYRSLGFEIAVSPESDDYIVNQGINNSHSETCYPVKLAHGHAAFLKDHLTIGRDKIFLVNAIGNEKKKYCPYVAGDGFLCKVALDIKNSDALLPVINFNDANYPIEKAVLMDLKRVFKGKFDTGDVTLAVKRAREAEREFLDEIYSTGDGIVESLRNKGEKIFIGIGRGYTIFDDKASSRVHELFAANGFHFVPSFFLSDPGYNIDEIAENMYWYQGSRIIKYNLMAAMDPLLFPVRETNFNCGTDSMLIYHEEDIMNRVGKPHLMLQTDGHSSNAQFGTRTLANYEVVRNYRQKSACIDDFKVSVKEPEIHEKILGIPYMGENSHVIASVFRALGFESEVMNTQTDRAGEFSRMYVYSNTCSPFAFQVGDSLAWLHELKERGIDPNKRATVFQPMAKGPCRFGQYHVLIRKFFNEKGFTGVSILNPDGDIDYSNVPVDGAEIPRLIKLYFKGTFCNDVLFDALLRARPYEKYPGSANNVYMELSRDLFKIIEEGADTGKLMALMQKSVSAFMAVVDPMLMRKPIVMMNGEIFVRSHPGANQNSIELLEKYGLEVRLASLSQWIEYTNIKSLRQFIKTNQWKKTVVACIKRVYMKRAGRKLYAPFREFLMGRESHDTDHMIGFAQEELVYDRLITGESPISIGEAYMFTMGKLQDICGIYHVGPFGCMHETAATSQIQSLAQQHRLRAVSINEKIVPFMDAVFGDSELPNLEAEIAAFAEKCYLKKVVSLQEN